MKARIESLIGRIERNPKSEEAINDLLELVTGDDADSHLEEIVDQLGAGWQRLAAAGRWNAACELLEILVELVDDDEGKAALLKQQARMMDEELFDQKGALERYRKLMQIAPEDAETATKVEEIEAERSRWQEIVETFQQQAEETTEASLKAHMLYSAAERTYQNHKRGKEIPDLLKGALAADPAHLKAAKLLERVLEERERWSDLADLYTTLAEQRSVKAERVQMLLAAAYTYGHRLEDLDTAALCYAEVLDFEPGQETALKFLVEYYEKSEDWDHLVAVYEDALRGRMAQDEESAMLMQVGMVHWRMRGDSDAAEEYFRRLRRIDAAHPGALNFYRKWAEEKGDKTRLLQILSDAQRATGDKALHDALTKEIAHLAAGEGGNVEKAIDAYKSVLRDEPDNVEARKELKGLYRQSEKWNALLEMLKNEAEALGEEDVAAKVGLYEQMVEIYRDHLQLEVMVIKTFDAILKIDPRNASALESLIATYESAGRWNDLIKLLGQRAEDLEDPAEKISVLNRIAGLWVEKFNNLNRAVEPLEEILGIDPTNLEAIETLKGVYQKRRAWKNLLELLEKEVDLLEGEARRDRLVEMAHLAGERVSDHARAIDLWRAALEVDPETPDALPTLEKLTERCKDWKALSDVIEMRLDRADDDEKVGLLVKLGAVYKDRIKDPARAAEVWRRVLEIQPGHAKAMRSLKESYQSAGDWDSLQKLYTDAEDFEGLVEVLGIAADRTDDRDTKKMLSFRCAEIYEDPIGQPDRAVRHYERVLSVDEHDERAARALVPIYRRSEKWNRLLGALGVVLEHTEGEDDRIALIEEMRELAADRLNNKALAFEWAARAFEERPRDARLRESLEEAAEAAGAVERLVEIYKAKLEAFEGEERVSMERHVAHLALDRLGSVDDAVAGYRAILEKRPDDEEALSALDDIFRAAARWEDLVGVFERRIDLASGDEETRGLLMELARLYEEGMDEPEKAAEHYGSVLGMFPDDVEALVALERIARISERWSDLAEILGKRRSLVERGDEEWREIGFQVANLFDEELGDQRRAIDTLQGILEERPGDGETISAMERFLRDERHRVRAAEILEPHLVATEDWRRLAWALAILIETTEDADHRLGLNVRLAEVYGDRLDDRRVAFDTLAAALRENPANVDLWNRMTDLAGDLDLLPELADRLSDAYGSGALGEAESLDLAKRLADILDERLGRPADAEKYHLEVLAADPGAAGSFESLKRLYTSSDRWDDLLELYRQALERDLSDEERLETLLNACFILDEVNHDVPEAIDSYRSVLEMDPENAQATRALTTLYEEAERWEDLHGLLSGQLEAASGDGAIQLRYRLGEISEHFLHRAEDALAQYEQVISEDPDHLKSQEALERLLEVDELKQRVARVLERTYEHQGAADPLARVLQIELDDDALSDGEKVDILGRIADLRERRLGNPDGAFEALSKAFVIDPGDARVAEEIARLAEEHGMTSEHAALLDSVIPGIEDDPALASRLMMQTARLYDEHLGDLEKAESAFRRLLDHDPENPDTAIPAVEALNRLLTAKESWEDLLRVLRVQVRLSGDPEERKQVLHRMADIEESVLERTDDAIGLFVEITDLDDTDMRALFGLERLYERAESWEKLIEVLRQRALLEESADMRREIYLRVARLYEENLDDDDEAIAAYCQVNDEVGTDREALEALARLYEKSQRWRDLLDVYESEEPLVTDSGERAGLLFRMGDLLRAQLGEPERSVERLGEVLSIDPGHQDARASLEAMLDGPTKIDVIRILRPIFEAEGNFERLLRFAEIEAQEIDDPLERTRVLRDAAEVAEVGTDDPRRAFDLLGRAFRDGTASPDLERIIDDLERLAAQIEAWGDLVALYREVGPDILDGDLQIRCNLRVAEIAGTMLEDVEVSREYYVKVLDMDGENAEAMNALERIYEAREQHLELFEIYRRKVQTETDEDLRREILFKQARVCELNLDDVSGATATYEAILDSDPENRQAMEALERLYPRSERWADLMDLLERRVDLEPSDKVDLLHRLGELAREKLGDDERALGYFHRALEADPSHAETLESLEAAMEDEAQRGRVAEILEPVYKRQGDWTKLVGATEARLEYCDDTTERKELLHQIGTLYEEQLGDLEKAFETFARLFEEDVEDRSSWDILGRLAAVLEAWPRLADVYLKALDEVVGDTPETAELAFMLGEIFESRLEEPEKAKEAYQRVLAFSPDDPRAFSAVERMYLATGSWSDLLELYRDAADAALDMEQRKQFIRKIAEIHERANEDVDAAINAYRDILEIDDGDADAIAALDRLYAQADRFEDLAMHLRAQVDRAPEPAARNDLRRALAGVYEKNLDDLPSAVDVYEEALAEEGGDPSSLAELERLILDEQQRQRIAEILEPVYRENDEWKKLVVILKTLVEYVDTPAEKVSRYREIASLHEKRGGSLLLAFGALSSAFEADPSEREVLGEMVRLAETIENWEDLAKTLEDTTEQIYDTDFKKHALHLLGQVYDHRLDNPRKAIEAYVEIIGLDEADGEALDALEGLYNLVGDWDGLVDVLERKSIIAASPEDRAAHLRAKASIHEDLMAAPKDAIDAYTQSLEADPSSLEAIDALERLYEGAEEWNDLIDVRRRRLEVVTEPADRVEIRRSIATTLEEKIDDAFEAITSWRALLEESPRDAGAVAALDRLFTKESMFPDLLENLRLQKEISQDQAQWIDIGMRIGDLQEKELADLEGAIDSYRDVLAQQPTHAGAIESLERMARDESVRERAIAVLEPLHREAARWDRLAEVLELKLEIVEDPAERLAEILSLAELHEVGRSDPHTAFDAYSRALAEDASRTDVMEALERIAAAESLWQRLAEVYLEAADATYDQAVERQILGRLGEVREVHLQDAKGAIEAYRRVLDIGADADSRVLFALDRLYEREAMWPELDEILQREIESRSETEEVCALRLRQGTIREREFEDVAGAIAAFRDVVEAAPDNDEGVAALEGLLGHDEFVPDIAGILEVVYETRGEPHKVGSLFEHRLRVAGTDEERVLLLSDLAAHQEQVLGDPSSAFDAKSKAFALAPTDPDLLADLERLADALGSWTSLVSTAERVIEAGRLDPIAEVELGLKVADWAATRVGDPGMAEARYRAVLERDPDHKGALSALERLLEGLGRFDDLVPVLQERARTVYDFADKKELLFRIAGIARSELGDSERAIRAYREVRELDEGDLDALDHLIALTEDTGDYGSLVDLLLSRASFTPDPLEGNGFRHRAATLYVGPLEDPERAVEVYREILDANPDEENATVQLEALYARLERWSDLQDLYSDRLANAMNEADRVAILRLLADLSETRFEALDEAADHLREILMIQPGDDAAAERLERIYSQSERWQDLVDLLEGRADRARDAGDSEGELSLLVRIGEIWDGRMSDPDRATEIYERVLERDPEHTRALAALARLYEAAEDWERCAEVLRKAADTGRGGPDQAEVHFRLARLHEAHLGDEDGAAEELRRAVSLDPSHAEANRALAEHCEKRGDHQGLLEALMREEMGLEDRTTKVAKLLEIADLQAGPLGDAAGSVASLERAREIDPASVDILLRLSDAYLSAGREEEAIPVIESLIDAETAGGKKRSKAAATYHQRLAKAYLGRGDRAKALEHLEGAYKMDVSNAQVLVDLGRLYYDGGDYDKAVKLFRALLLQRLDPSMGISKADIYWYVGDISLKQGDPRKAKGMFQRGLDEQPGHEGCKTGLAQC